MLRPFYIYMASCVSKISAKLGVGRAGEGDPEAPANEKQLDFHSFFQTLVRKRIKCASWDSSRCAFVGHSHVRNKIKPFASRMQGKSREINHGLHFN